MPITLTRIAVERFSLDWRGGIGTYPGIHHLYFSGSGRRFGIEFVVRRTIGLSCFWIQYNLPKKNDWLRSDRQRSIVI